MQEQKPHKLFAIVSTVMGCDTAHTYGLILDVDAQGIVTGFTPVDFDGKHVYEWRNDRVGKYSPTVIPHTDGDKALLFPITDETAQELLKTMEYIRNGGSQRFRMRAGLSEPHPDFIRYVRPSDAPGTFSTTCRDFLMNHLLKIGGVPIGDIRDGSDVMPAFESSWDVRDFIQAAAGMKGQMCVGRLDGKMHDVGNGRLFYAYNGSGDLVAALNKLPRQADGRTVAQTLLEDSQPFYEPSLVELPKDQVSGATSLASQRVDPEAARRAVR